MKSRVVMPPPLSLVPSLEPRGVDPLYNAFGQGGFESSFRGMDAMTNCYQTSAVTETDLGNQGQEKNRLIELLTQFVSAKVSSGSAGQYTSSDLNVGTEQYAKIAAPSINQAFVANDSAVDMMLPQPAVHASLETDDNKGSSEDAMLLVAYIPRTAPSSAVQDVFSKFGTVGKVHLVKDKHGQSKCYGFVYFQSVQAAARAVKECTQGAVIMHDETGKAWHVKASWARRKPANTRTKNWNRSQRSE